MVEFAPEYFVVGDKVEKYGGYKWPGVIVSAFKTLEGRKRYVVECTVPDVAGALHIYAPYQIRHQNMEAALEQKSTA